MSVLLLRLFIWSPLSSFSTHPSLHPSPFTHTCYITNLRRKANTQSQHGLMESSLHERSECQNSGSNSAASQCRILVLGMSPFPNFKLLVFQWGITADEVLICCWSFSVNWFSELLKIKEESEWGIKGPDLGRQWFERSLLQIAFFECFWA